MKHNIVNGSARVATYLLHNATSTTYKQQLEANLEELSRAYLKLLTGVPLFISK